MNITAFEYEDSIVVVDFPDDDMQNRSGDSDVTYLKENADRVKGFVITHGHEDHIGALPVCAAGVEYSDLMRPD